MKELLLISLFSAMFSAIRLFAGNLIQLENGRESIHEFPVSLFVSVLIAVISLVVMIFFPDVAGNVSETIARVLKI